MHDIISELCKIPSARDEFQLGDGVWFDNHANALDETEGGESEADLPSNSQPSRPDQFCIHRVDGDTSTLLTTVEYKPPHKLSVENLRSGLRPIHFYHEIVELDTIPTSGPEKLKYNATRLTGSALLQEYHVMIQEGLEYSYLTTGLGHVQLWVPFDDPSTLYYDLCEPNLDVDVDARPPDSDHDSAEYTSSEKTSSAYQPSSSPVESPVVQGRRVPTRSQAGCAPSDVSRGEDSSDSDADSAASAGRKRGFSQITSSPPTQRPISTTQSNPQRTRGGQFHPHDNKFCTQRCLLGLQKGGILDAHCPNVDLHRAGAMATDTRSTWKSWYKWSSSSWMRTLIVIALRWGAVGRTGRRSRSLVPHTVIQLLVKERRLDFGRRCHVKRTSTVFFSVYRGLRFRSSLEGLTWPRFISCMARERSTTCSSWAGAVTV